MQKLLWSIGGGGPPPSSPLESATVWVEKLYNDGVVQAVKFAKLSSTDCFSCSISVKRVMRATYFACPMFVTGDQLTVRATDSASNYICYCCCCMNDDCTMRGLTWMPQDGKMFFLPYRCWRKWRRYKL